jgi:hypothetical protein
MSNWFHKFFNPHCPHCLDEVKESKVCLSCETLKQQLERANYENQRLLDKLVFTEPKVEVPQKPVDISAPKNIPWNVRRQMLEIEDREKAKLIREAPKPISTEDLEKELDVAQEARGGN